MRAIEVMVNELGYECVHVAVLTEFERQVVRVLIDSLGGIAVADCERVSRAVDRYLDTAEFSELGARYYLEVSSPGLERPLFTPNDYRRFEGKEARVKTHTLVDGRKLHLGVIAAANDAGVTLMTEQGERVLPFGVIARASLVFKGLEPQQPKNKREPRKKRNGGNEQEP